MEETPRDYRVVAIAFIDTMLTPPVALHSPKVSR